MIWLQISAGQGPAECAWVVTKLTDYLLNTAARDGIKIQLIEAQSAEEPKLIKSALLSLEGPEAESFANNWQGSIQWIGQSTFRPHHRRKNWFVGIEAFAPPQITSWNLKDFRFESTRSSGPGGQNVNKVETAIRVTHLPSGLSVLASEERSQNRNKQLGLARLVARLEQQGRESQDQARNQRRQAHYELERGNAVKIFKGPDFKLTSG